MLDLSALTEPQRQTLRAYAAELVRVNRTVNLVARPLTASEAERHVRHSLALAARPFPAGATVVDWGSGGGLPAVPLAIVFPDARFVAVDAVRKKTEAVRLFARRLRLDNVDVWNGRAEAYDGPAPTHAVSRATAPLVDLWGWFERARRPQTPGSDGVWPPGLVCLKGAGLIDEADDLRTTFPEVEVEEIRLDDVLGPEWVDKAIVQVTGMRHGF